jgi:hypothetical protein
MTRIVIARVSIILTQPAVDLVDVKGRAIAGNHDEHRLPVAES